MRPLRTFPARPSGSGNRPIHTTRNKIYHWAAQTGAHRPFAIRARSAPDQPQNRQQQACADEGVDY
jgi:hypothetical protein